MPAGQKRAPDLITDSCEPPCGCWELNSGPLEDQAMLLTSEPSLQPPPLLSNVLNTKCILLKLLRKLMKNQKRINVNVDFIGFC